MSRYTLRARSGLLIAGLLLLPAVAVAVRATGTPTTKAVPFTGPVRIATGGVVETVTLTAEDETTTLLESVTRAVRDWVPVEVGVQDAV